MPSCRWYSSLSKANYHLFHSSSFLPAVYLLQKGLAHNWIYPSGLTKIVAIKLPFSIVDNMSFCLTHRNKRLHCGFGTPPSWLRHSSIQYTWPFIAAQISYTEVILQILQLGKIPSSSENTTAYFIYIPATCIPLFLPC